MAGRFARTVQGWHQRRTEERWARLTETATELESFELRALRTEARELRRRLDRVLQVADARLAVPSLCAGLPQVPFGTDWSWRPDLWQGALAEPGSVASGNRTALIDGVALYHDCPLGEVVVRQVRNDRPEDRAPFGLAIDIFGFQGSFLSLALNLPDAGRDKVAEFDLAYAGLNDRRIERAWVDLILNDADMTRIVIRDLVVSRRPRAEL